MKRAQAQVFDGGPEAWRRRYQTAPQQWREQRCTWRQCGLSKAEILAVTELLQRSCPSREDFEENLRDHAVLRSDSQPSAQRTAIRRKRRVLLAALTVLEEDRNSVGTRLWRGRSLDRAIRTLRVFLKPPALAALPSHRPGEPWAVPYIDVLGRCFLHRGTSHMQTVCLVHAALTLAGHGDVITQEAVRHVLRTTWRKRVPAVRESRIRTPRQAAAACRGVQGPPGEAPRRPGRALGSRKGRSSEGAPSGAQRGGRDAEPPDSVPSPRRWKAR
jgi:hypothetical protein